MMIEYLSLHPEHLPTIAQWHFQEWGHFYPQETLQDFEEDLRQCLQDKPVPTTLIAIEGQDVIASASVIDHDMTTHPELSPWLANVFVHPDYRGKGLGVKIVKELMAYCQQQGLERLYLFTADQQSFYQRLGWVELYKESYHGEIVSIMSADLRKGDSCTFFRSCTDFMPGS